MKKFFPLEVIESEGIKYALGKARLNEIYRERVHGAKAAQQNANFMPSARIIPCKVRVWIILEGDNPSFLLKGIKRAGAGGGGAAAGGRGPSRRLGRAGALRLRAAAPRPCPFHALQ